jgi:hypothetical protein
VYVYIPLEIKNHPWGSSSPLEVMFAPGGQVHPWGSSSPLGVKFTPGGQVQLWGSSSQLGEKFMYLWGKLTLLKAGLGTLPMSALPVCSMPTIPDQEEVFSFLTPYSPSGGLVTVKLNFRTSWGQCYETASKLYFH